MNQINNIKKILENFSDGIEYVKLRSIYENTYGVKLDINKPKKKLEKDFIIEKLNNSEWNIKNKECKINIIKKDKDIKTQNIDNYIFTNTINYTSFLIGKNGKDQNQYLNIYEPFSCIISGVQGSGKSYTTNKILEGCILETNNKCSTLICHYDTNREIICESAGLCFENNNTVILTSPSNYFNRKKIYHEKLNNKINIIPLLFDFKLLTIKMLKILMNVKSNDNQLYMQGILNVLRKSCKKINGIINNFSDFENEIKKELNLDKQQQTPLLQRLELLKSFLIDSKENTELLKYYKINDLNEIFKEGNLVIIDLTDDLIDSNYANEVFRLMVDMFKSSNLNVSKLLIFDEAHKYLTDKEDSLNNDIIEIIRMQRHYGIRTILSTQNPCFLNKEIIELSNFILLHRFSSPRWYEYIKKIYNINEYIVIDNLKINTFDYLLKIDTGICILVCPKQQIFMNLKIKKRITYDLGNSVTF